MRRSLRTPGWCLLCSAIMLAGHASAGPLAKPAAELLHFTDDTTATGKPLRPGFLHHSVWCAIGRADNGKIYIAVSNHQQPSGNVLFYAYDPEANQFAVIDDLKAVSTKAGNWLKGESQHKVHTFLQQHADGQLYFATMNAAPSPVLRGSHLYTLDPKTDTIQDKSPSLPGALAEDLKSRHKEPGYPEQGVFIQTLGVRGMALHPAQKDYLYAMVYPGGQLIRANLDTGDKRVVGKSTNDNFIFYAAANGSVYFGDGDNAGQALKRYDPATQKTTTISDRVPPGEFGAIAPTHDGQGVYFLLAEQKVVYYLNLKTQTFRQAGKLCGDNWWRLYNLHLSPTGKNLYYVSNNNNRKTIRRLHLKTGLCREVLDIEKLLGTRQLCFGGIGVWDDQGAFYAPVWTLNAAQPDLAILKATVEEPARIPNEAAGP